MPTTVTITPVAALRQLRRAAWWSVTPEDFNRAHGALINPMGHLERAWHHLSRAHSDYLRLRTADSWATLSIALGAFDQAAAAFFGPSGWEH